MDIHEYIRNRITELRLNRSITESQLSKDLGHARSYLSNMNRENTIPSIQSIVDICDYFDITVSEFFAGFVSKINDAKSPVQLDIIRELLEKTSNLNDQELNILLCATKNLTKSDINNLAQFLLKLEKSKR